MRSRAALVAAAAAAIFMIGSGEASAADDVGVVDTRSGTWYLRDADTGETTSFYYGNPGDTPFMGDWDCDGVATPGLYRRSDGFVYLRNSNTQGIAHRTFFFGNPGDIPLAGDFDGDGCDTVGLYRPGESRVYVINELGVDGAGLGAADFSYVFGDPGDVPFVGDFDGDGFDTVGMYRAVAGAAHVSNTLGSSFPDVTVDVSGLSAVVVAGDWGSGVDEVGRFETPSGTFRLPDGAGGEQAFAYGHEVHLPVAGSFGDLPGGDDPPPPAPAPPAVGSGKRIIYSNSEQRIWLIDEAEHLVATYLVSGRRGIPAAGTYSVYSKSEKAWAPYGGITMNHMVRFARGAVWPYGFHSIPRYPNGQPLQTEDQLGQFRSGGCVRQADHHAAFLFDWTPIGTTVHVLP